MCRGRAGIHVGPASSPNPEKLMSYLVLARKWRPKTFDEIVGQGTVVRTLKNALASGRIGHAFLLSGARGVGKTTTARILAKALNCSQAEGPTAEPCGACASCVEIAAGTGLDVQEIDGATNNGVEQVRELRESARYNPARDRFKIWIIDEVHMLSTGAFNALLKTLEEPPPRVKFIFATTEYHKIPDTILSRCQQYDFRLVTAKEIQTHLRQVAGGEGIEVSDESLARLAHAAEGSVRDALSLFDQVLSFSGQRVNDEDLSALLGFIDRELLLEASSAIAATDSLRVLSLVERLSDYGADHRNFVRELLLHFREILLVKVAPDSDALLSQILPEERARLRPLADAFSEEDLLRMIDVLAKTDAELRLALDPRVTLELALLKMAHLRRLVPFGELVARLEGRAPALPDAPGRPIVAPALPRSPAPAPNAPRVAAPSAASPGVPSPAGDLMAGLLAQAQTRPSLAPPLRRARGRVEGDVCTLFVAPTYGMLAQSHASEYEAMASAVLGRKVRVKIEVDQDVPAVAEGSDAPVADTAKKKRERLIAEASKEPAVQEALDLFGGRIVDVREAK